MDATWFREIKKDINGKNKQARVHISQKLKKLLKTQNWKAPGPDGVQGFWLKNFTSLHKPFMAPQCLPGRRNTTIDD